MAVTQMWLQDTISVYELDMDNPRYVVSRVAAPEGIFVRVRATFVSLSESGLRVRNDGDFTLIGENGVSYQVATPATITSRRVRYRETPLVDVTVPPGELYDALLFFDIPRAGAQQDLKLRFRDEPPVPFVILPNR